MYGRYMSYIGCLIASMGKQGEEGGGGISWEEEEEEVGDSYMEET